MPTKIELITKYPLFTVRSEPLADCPNCKGNGEYFSKAKVWRLCLCAAISREEWDKDNEVLKLAVDTLHRKIPRGEA